MQGHRPHVALIQVLVDLEDEALAVDARLQGLAQGRELPAADDHHRSLDL